MSNFVWRRLEYSAQLNCPKNSAVQYSVMCCTDFGMDIVFLNHVLVLHLPKVKM